ncbi:MAG: NADH-ubiquinone oxidoreductase-F iron-sulfur binding region domain-containing protein [Thermodesulfobacteriota bacterium]
MPEPRYSYIALCSRDENCTNQVHEVTTAFQEKFKDLGVKVGIRKIKTVCSGRCNKGVFVDIGGAVFYHMVRPDNVESVIRDTILEGDVLSAHYSIERSFVGDEKVIYDRAANVLIYIDSQFCLAEGLRGLLRKDGLSSCGKCVPCRLGVKKLDQILSALLAGKARVDDVDRLRELAVVMDASSRCALAGKFVAPLFVAMDNFGEELNFVCVLSEDASRVCELKDSGGRCLTGSA